MITLGFYKLMIEIKYRGVLTEFQKKQTKVYFLQEKTTSVYKMYLEN